MTEREPYSTSAAREAARRGELARFVAEFLASPGSDNAALAEQLTDPPRLWLGPVRVRLDRLHRLAGPPGEPVLCPQDDDWWGEDVEEMEELIEDGWEPPPVIATYQSGQLVLEDGNHRIESLRRAGEQLAWTIVGFEDAGDFERFARLTGTSARDDRVA